MKKTITLILVLLSTISFSQNLELVLVKRYVGDSLNNPDNISLSEIKKLNFYDCPCHNEFKINSDKIMCSSICNNNKFNYTLNFINDGNQYTCFNNQNDYMVTYKLIEDNNQIYLIDYHPFDSYNSYTIWLCKKKGE
jgi:hypothetical protein